MESRRAKGLIPLLNVVQGGVLEFSAAGFNAGKFGIFER